jgi:hypothetical protein
MGIHSSKYIPTGVDVTTQDVFEKTIEEDNDDSRQLQDTPLLRALLRPIECPICLDIFDDKSNNPCTLTCGHSICIQHANDIKSCPICRCKLSQGIPLKKCVALSEIAVALAASSLVTLQEITQSSTHTEILDFGMQCPICWIKFNDGPHTPCTISSYGHSFCLQHNADFKSRCCPICREPFPDAPLVKSPL